MLMIHQAPASSMKVWDAAEVSGPSGRVFHAGGRKRARSPVPGNFFGFAVGFAGSHPGLQGGSHFGEARWGANPAQHPQLADGAGPVKRPNPLPPDRMDASERLRALCHLLALGLLRLRGRDRDQYETAGMIRDGSTTQSAAGERYSDTTKRRSR